MQGQRKLSPTEQDELVEMYEALLLDIDGMTRCALDSVRYTVLDMRYHARSHEIEHYVQGKQGPAACRIARQRIEDRR